jgi:GMP synthase-like glutamine amidotransferase
VLGICLGCQIIADALGGRAYRVDPQEAGLIDIRLNDAGLRDPVLAEVTGPFASWHHDSWDLPPGGTLLAVTDLYPQAFRSGSAVGVQFHPEVTAEVLQGWIRRGESSLRDSGVDPSEFLSTFQNSRQSFVRRADVLFGAWIAEVQGHA